MHPRLSAVEVGCVVGQQVTQSDIECLGDRKHIAQAWVGWCLGIGLPALELPIGVAGESCIGRDPVLGVSLGGTGPGDVGTEFPGIVTPGRISFVHNLNANGMSCPHGHVCMT